MWCRAGSKGLPCGRLFSSSIDGSVSEWDIFHLKQKVKLLLAFGLLLRICMEYSAAYFLQSQMYSLNVVLHNTEN